MGLDMMIYAIPKIKNITIQQTNALESYWNWKQDKEMQSKYTLEEYVGSDNIQYINNMSDYMKNKLKKYIKTQYYDFDTEHKYPHEHIYVEKAYWRKANAVHKWFVDNAQNGVDDCGYYEITEEILIKLRDICADILQNCIMVQGTVRNGQEYTTEGWRDILEDGLVVINPEYAAERLPTQCGFFFGSTDYDEYYIDDIRSTWEQITAILDKENKKYIDWENEKVYYHSSW